MRNSAISVLGGVFQKSDVDQISAPVLAEAPEHVHIAVNVNVCALTNDCNKFVIAA